jgi:uncharacterized protein (TIGR03663 family)
MSPLVTRLTSAEPVSFRFMAKRHSLVPLVLVLLAAALRLTFLDLKPPHFDEGINGWFCDQMSKTGYYSYDPTNYHGPLHFYVLFASLHLLGRNLWALRLPVVLIGTLTVWLLTAFRPFLGARVAYLAALALTVSPGFVFYNRYSIHETWLVFFLILTFWGGLRLYHLRDPISVWACVFGLAGAILTKETYLLHFLAFALALPIFWGLQKIRPSTETLQPCHEPLPRSHLAAAVAVSVGLIIFFYSGTFLHWSGVKGLYQTFTPWTKTGLEAAGHGKAQYDLFPILPDFLGSRFAHLSQFKLNWYWVKLFTVYEWFCVAGLVYSVRYLLGGNAVLRYLAIYAGGTLLIYSVIPYKTPWCIISIAWPYLFLGADLVRELGERFREIAGILVAAGLLAHDGWQTYQVNFVKFDSPKEPYVYVQTFRDYDRFIKPILALAGKDKKAFENLHGIILLPSYYPIPWALGDIPNTGYYTKADQWPANLDADFIAVEEESADALEAKLKDRYYRVNFRLRDGMGDCSGYFRASTFKDVFPNQKPEFDPSASEE